MVLLPLQSQYLRNVFSATAISVCICNALVCVYVWVGMCVCLFKMIFLLSRSLFILSGICSAAFSVYVMAFKLPRLSYVQYDISMLSYC